MPDYTISDKDKALFRQAIKTLDDQAIILKEEESVNILKGYTPKEHLPTVSNLEFKSEQSVKIANQMQPIYLSDHFVEAVQSESLLSYAHFSLPNKHFQKFLRANFLWEAKLDLHGLNLELAKNSLIHFILGHSTSANRHLLVIHGKGGRNNSMPILKNLVNYWLPQFPQVLAFRSAAGRDGGAGAVYVLLKKVSSLA